MTTVARSDRFCVSIIPLRRAVEECSPYPALISHFTDTDIALRGRGLPAVRFRPQLRDLPRRDMRRCRRRQRTAQRRNASAGCHDWSRVGAGLVQVAAHWSGRKNPRVSDPGVCMERVTRIELALSAWEADVLPLNYTRVTSGGPAPRSRCPNARSLYPIVDPRCPDRGSTCVRGMGSACGGTELGRTVAGGERGRAGPECRLESRLFDPVMWLSSAVQQADAALGEGT